MKKIVCPKCRVGGYDQGKATDGRPEFVCTRCGHTWTSGLSGKPYVKDSKVNKGDVENG